MRILLVSAFLCAAFTLPALADQATESPTPPPASAAAPDPDQKLICIRKEPPTGSFIRPKPECHTRAEWAHANGSTTDNGVSNVQTYGSMDRGRGNGTP
jgi:hypothetical protein